MATGKARGNKRPTATSSYSSATTIVIFVVLSVLGLWLLTSNTFAPPQSATKHITSIGQTHHPKENDPPSDPNNGKADEAAIEPDTKMEIEEPQPDKGVTLTDQHISRGSEDEDSKEEAQKQEALETQTSEESSMTLKQVEQVIEENPHSETKVENNDQESKANHDDEGGSDKNQVSLNQTSDATENQITDEDQQQRIEEHQQQEDGQNQQDPNGATSHDQTQHDDAPIDSHEQGSSSSQVTEEPNAQSTNQETKHDSSDENREKEALSKETNQEIASDNDDVLTEMGDSSGIPEESAESKKSWNTQAHQSEDQKERRKAEPDDKESSNDGHTWLLCNVTAGADYIPCLDNEKVIASIHSRLHHEHRERHCPKEPSTCLVPLPQGYKRRIEWPKSRDKIWYSNVPHTSLAEYKGHQNWVKVTGEFLTFPGGGTQFIHGALHYIDFLQKAVPEISWGKHSRVVLDVGCGVASFGGYLFEKDVITMSFAPKDEHEAQVQFALERGIPAISAVMGSQRLPFPGSVFDVVHCARCRVPWHADGGSLLLELNRVLRPGGYFVWSATPVYQKLEEDVQIWKEMSQLTVAMCWELVTVKKDKTNSIGAAIYQKPDSNDCYERRKKSEPPLCKTDDDTNAAWYILLQSCMHQIPTQENERGSQWPEEWPERLQTPPYWLNKSQMGIYGKPAPDDFTSDYQHWKKVVSTMYTNDMGINWSEVRNVMDLRAVYGGFAAALKDHNLWVMNVVNIDSPDTLPIIYERGLFGIYHDWCESFSTYPRSYDLLHADHLFSRLKKRCTLEVAMAEFDRILRPGGKLIVRDEVSIVAEVEDFLKSLHWEVFLNQSNNQEGILSAQKSDWRPTSFADPS